MSCEETVKHKYWAIVVGILVICVATCISIAVWSHNAYPNPDAGLSKERLSNLEQRMGNMENYMRDIKVVIDIKKKIDP